MLCRGGASRCAPGVRAHRASLASRQGTVMAALAKRRCCCSVCTSSALFCFHGALCSGLVLHGADFCGSGAHGQRPGGHGELSAAAINRPQAIEDRLGSGSDACCRIARWSSKVGLGIGGGCENVTGKISGQVREGFKTDDERHQVFLLRQATDLTCQTLATANPLNLSNVKHVSQPLA